MENNNNRLIQHNSPSETRCVVIVQSCSVYISIYTYSHETQQLHIISSDI